MHTQSSIKFQNIYIYFFLGKLMIEYTIQTTSCICLNKTEKNILLEKYVYSLLTISSALAFLLLASCFLTELHVRLLNVKILFKFIDIRNYFQVKDSQASVVGTN